jgi:hypothetical protein
MIEKHNSQINMTYENLVRAVFKCKLYEGPYKCAHQNVYFNAFCEVPNRLGRLIMKCIIDRILSDNTLDEAKTDKLLDQWIKLDISNTQEEVIVIIEDLVDLLNEIGY